MSNTFDNALYPVMFVDYLYYFPLLRVTGVARWLVSAAMLAVVTALNLVGVDVVANASNVFALLVISLFAALVVAGVPQLELEPLLAPPTRPVEWGVFPSVPCGTPPATTRSARSPPRSPSRAATSRARCSSRSSSSLSSTSCRSASAPLSMPSG